MSASVGVRLDAPCVAIKADGEAMYTHVDGVIVTAKGDEYDAFVWVDAKLVIKALQQYLSETPEDYYG